ncbi:hypothetical protein GF412_03535 [Candidatus Micrarchaeota archaeon]|nr:hypothetical protein [Candidatus Micrarchaeota archaeon]MBD3418023.1 hypothetical protein [Candidatus Micrarchaeota archaeon]
MLDLPTAAKLMRDAFKTRNQRKMRKANDKIMREWALSHSKELYQLSVYSYVLSKVLSKPRFMGRAYAEKHKQIDSMLSKLVSLAEKEDRRTFMKTLTKLKSSIKDVESSDARYIKNMFEKGRLKTAATLYAQGLSLSAASEITGVEKQEIMDYAGKTLMFDRMEDGKPLSKRLKNAKHMLIGGK